MKLEKTHEYKGWNWSNYGTNWRNWKFVCQSRVKMHKFRTNNQNEKVANIGVDNWVWYGWNCIKLKVFVSIQGACATIERIWTKLKPFQIPN